MERSQNVRERSTIEFPHPIGRDEPHPLFKYLSENLGGELIYSIIPRTETRLIPLATGEVSIDLYGPVLEVSGNIQSNKNPMGEHRQETVNLWDGVSDRVIEHFEDQEQRMGNSSLHQNL